ncbi:RteC domain-containing protein [Psychroserpens burtonensis]|uniref:RteC domain-containing protein n=1 Tax=Psychroserpens burtonensis TaxID=49278 RepID=UPI0036F2249E
MALIKLIYALHYIKVINKLETDIKETTILVKNIFNIDLDDYSFSCLEIGLNSLGRFAS